MTFRKRLQSRWLEIKYLLLGVVALGALGYLSRTAAFDGIAGAVEGFLTATSKLGLIGIFAGALLANMTVVINVPYSLMVLPFAMVNNNPLYWLLLAVVQGTGSTLGKLFSYQVTTNLAQHLEALSKSGLYRWIKHTIERRPRITPLYVFFAGATPLPDDVVVIPLAMIAYPVRKLALPLLAGKVLHSFTLIALFAGAVGLVDGHTAPGIKIDLMVGLLVIAALVVLYQGEKADRAEQERKHRHTDDPRRQTRPLSPVSTPPPA
jgi:hypothetical protein